MVSRHRRATCRPIVAPSSFEKRKCMPAQTRASLTSSATSLDRAYCLGLPVTVLSSPNSALAGARGLAKRRHEFERKKRSAAQRPICEPCAVRGTDEFSDCSIVARAVRAVLRT